MSYQVLARKWRPQNFHELVGQEHVKQALVNALNEQRLHHAYLFTGTRGVGKTTIARIFAKSLNCDTGITSTPCGSCASCLDIEAGRFIDLIEIDAASRTKVEDTREILDNVQYAPTRGRYKVYLIDEVHMLSKHSFNALLKTLEEPPAHVKFLLATTDPQKLPITILSRCLQFNLAALSRSEIVDQLKLVLPQENVSFDEQALELLAKAADGSMRDGLSLTDQAIAQTNGKLEVAAIAQMLGLMDTQHAATLLSHILLQDGQALMAEIEKVSMKSPNYKALLDDLLTLTHAIQLTQLVPEAALVTTFDKETITTFSHSANALQIQSLYQLMLGGKRDLQWAPDAKLGFEMLMLRLLAFEKTGLTQQSNTAAIPGGDSPETQSRAKALRAILNKNKAATQTTHVAAQDTAHLQKVNPPQPVMADPVNQSLVKTDIKEAQKEPPIQARTQHAEATPNSVEYGDINDEEDDVDMSYHQQAQYENLMAQAEEQGFSSDVVKTDVEGQSNAAIGPLASEHTSMADALEHKSKQAQSAIARILQNRKIQGAERLSTPSDAKEHDPLKKLEAAQLARHVEPQSQIKHEGERVRAQNTSPVERPKKVDFRERHKVDESKLAPELIAQLNPEQQPQAPESQESVIPAPENFESPISDIRYAHQQDRWAELIELMGLGGRSRQFALHSIFNQQGNRIELQVDQSQQHLDGTMLRNRLQDKLSEVLNASIELIIEFAPGIMESPYLIQQKIDAGRLAQAVEVIAQDPNVKRMNQEFAAVVDENSIRAL
ncbi:DNA polymerase III subunits gamma and tau [Pseudoalteromonas luteoviolacea B = ATCC 29581]|nr:DNA polymerase III subunits gamma and tau [Pseudoalteromonas luteoviolacea B = ATCC 29581]